MTPRIRRYIAEAAEIFDIPAERIVGPSKDAAASAARTVIYQALREDGFNLSQIARWFRRDHSSVGYALRRGLR